jgi:peptidoglycan/LPS O-acetylase OafA/YrhL
MPIENPGFFFALVIAALALVSLPVFRIADAAAQVHNRYATLDGLRGLLAFSVFVFHLVVTRGYVLTGEWRLPSTPFYSLLGPTGVSLFFMITGFLFWTKLLEQRGRQDWHRLYLNRLLRIAPLYLFAVLAMLVVVFARTDFTLHEPAAEVMASVLQWLSLGVLDFQPDVNGYPATHVLAGVTWTIAYEWAFYGSLLLTAYFARGRAHLFFALTGLALCLLAKHLFSADMFGFAALFLCGMTIASLLHAGRALRVTDRVSSLLALGCLCAIFSAAPLGHALSGYSSVTTLLLAAFLYLVCSGASLFGLLSTNCARRLGNVSYSLYLLQGLALTLVFAIPALREFALRSARDFWLIGAVCTAVLVSVSCYTYAFIEYPFMLLGRSRARLGAASQAATRHASGTQTDC